MFSLSVIIPVYNVEPYIQKAVMSVIEQLSDCDGEIILVADHGSDKSEEICMELAKRYPDVIKLITGEKSSLADARNKGLCQASKEWIMFADSDDFWKENALHNLIRETEENPGFDIYITKWKEYHEETGEYREPETKKPYFSGSATAMDLKEKIERYEFTCKWAVWKLLIRRELIEDNDIEFSHKCICAEDLLFVIRLLLSTNQIYYTDTELYQYRIDRKGCLSEMSAVNCYKCMYYTAKQMTEMKQYKKKISYNDYKSAQQYMTSFYFYWMSLCYCLPEDKRKERAELIRHMHWADKYYNAKQSDIKTVLYYLLYRISYVFADSSCKIWDKYFKS